MKKRVLALIAATALVAASAMPAFATEKRSSPENVTITPTPSPENVTITPTPSPENVTITPTSAKTAPGKSPKTGEVDYVLYGGLGAAAFASVVVFCKKKEEEA